MGAFVKIDVTKEGASVSSKESWSLKAARKAHWCVSVCVCVRYYILYTQIYQKLMCSFLFTPILVDEIATFADAKQIQCDPVGLPRNMAASCVDSGDVRPIFGRFFFQVEVRCFHLDWDISTNPKYQHSKFQMGYDPLLC